MIGQYETTSWISLISFKLESRSKFGRRNLARHCQCTKNFLSTDPWITFLWIWSRCTSTFTINVLNIYGSNRCTPRVVKLIFHRLKGMSGINNDGCCGKLRYLKNANPCLKGHLQRCCKDIHCLSILKIRFHSFAHKYTTPVSKHAQHSNTIIRTQGQFLLSTCHKKMMEVDYCEFSRCSGVSKVVEGDSRWQQVAEDDSRCQQVTLLSEYL